MSLCSGKTALVTDCGSSENGRVAAVALAREGAQVLVHSRRPSAKVNAIVEKICSAGGKARAIAGDLTETHGPHQLAQDTRAIIGERLDILVINLTPGKPSTLDAATVQEFDAQFAASIRAPFFLIQQLLPILREGSCIVFAGTPRPSLDDACSFYLSADGSIPELVGHFTPSLSSRKIRVNAIVLESGSTDSEIATPRRNAEAMSKASASRAPGGALGATIAMLVSGSGDWSNGQTIQFSQ